MKDREAYLILNMITGIGPVRLAKLCSVFGSPSAILNATKKELSFVDGISHDLAGAIAEWKNTVDFEAEIKFAQRAGVKIITKIDEEYPALLKQVDDAPLCLYVRGTFDPENQLLVGIVGSRRNTNYGRGMSEYLSRSAVYAGWTVVSGLAYGTDASAHKACIEVGGKTIAVLGGGLARIFPQEHVPLAKKIVETGGAVVSEFPMEFPPNRKSFPMRNRIISGMSSGIIVVEAGTTSGALITAKFALEQGRQVFAVPGQADNPQARGTNKLIKDGAKLVENFEDFLEEFDFLPGFERKTTDNQRIVNSQEETEKQKAILQGLDNEMKKIIDVLKKGEATADKIADLTAIPAGKLLSLLFRLEMKKIISQSPGKRFSLVKHNVVLIP